jgi:hypothetical protein
VSNGTWTRWRALIGLFFDGACGFFDGAHGLAPDAPGTTAP